MSKAKAVSYRQGDVLLVEVKDAPMDGTERREGGDIVFMHGEVTGHAHRIIAPETKARLIDANAERYLHALQEVTVTHEEHGPIILRKGKYQQAFQVEEHGEEVRRVAD